MQQLPQFDQDMTKKLKDAEDAGEVSIYRTSLLIYSHCIG